MSVPCSTHPGLKRLRDKLEVVVPLNFLTIHYCYFIFTSLITSAIFYAGSSSSGHVSFTDALFLCISAITGAGLNTVNLSELNTFQQVMLFFLIMIGSPILVSIVVIYVRKRAFEDRLQSLNEQRQKRRQRRLRSRSLDRLRRPSFRSSNGDLGVVRRATERTGNKNQDEAVLTEDGDHHHHHPDGGLMISSIALESGARPAHVTQQEEPEQPAQSVDGSPQAGDRNAGAAEHIRFDQSLQHTRLRDARAHHRHPLINIRGVGAISHASLPEESTARPTSSAARAAEPEKSSWGADALGFSRKLISRNSQFPSLTDEERDKLGGVEYRSLEVLAIVIPLYFGLFCLLGGIGVGAWFVTTKPDLARANGLNPFWVGLFFAISAFCNSGMALLDANAVAIQKSVYPLLTMALLILAGNTLYPVLLRFIIWSLKSIASKRASWAERHQVLQFILDHPRRVYTNLFPARQTWWLLTTIIVLNGIDWIGFEILNIGNEQVNDIPTGYRVLDGLFQAFAVRSGGFYVVTISSLRQSLLLLYIFMMYLSVYPVAVSIRSTNPYEERSIGIYAEDMTETPEQADKANNTSQSFAGTLRRKLTGTTNAKAESRAYFVRHQIRSQLSHDMWPICLAILLITIIEASNYERHPIIFSSLNIAFEVVSAYGCVGISTGVPWAAYSFSGAWHTLSKLILCFVMLRGRHRGLPVSIDKALLLPSETLAWAEEEDAVLRLERTMTTPRSVHEAV